MPYGLFIWHTHFLIELVDPQSEFGPYLDKCRFSGCLHDREPDCAVRTAVEEGLISAERYENYRMLYHDLKDRKRIY